MVRRPIYKNKDNDSIPRKMLDLIMEFKRIVMMCFLAYRQDKMMNILTAGTQAPEFTLKDQHGTDVALTQFRGKKVLVYFYPKAMTPGCTTQACGLRDSYSELEQHQVVTLGISPDLPEKLLRFEARDQLNFTLLSDPDHSVADQFGVWGTKKFMGKTFDGIHRISFLIDEQGIIKHVFDTFKTKDHHLVVLNFLKTLSD